MGDGRCCAWRPAGAAMHAAARKNESRVMIPSGGGFEYAYSRKIRDCSHADRCRQPAAAPASNLLLILAPQGRAQSLRHVCPLQNFPILGSFLSKKLP